MLYKTVKLTEWEKISEVIYKNLPEEYKISGGFRSHDPVLFEKCKPLVKAISEYTDWSNVENVATLTVNPFKEWPIHTDWMMSVPYSLNIPIFNCTKDTYTTFFKIKDDMNHKSKNSSIDKLLAVNYLEFETIPEGSLFEKDEVEEIDRFYLLEPTLYKIDVPHTVYNIGSDVRISISLRFKTHVDF